MNLNRRQFATLPAAAAISGLTLPAATGSNAVLAQENSGEIVPMFRGNAARTGEMPGPGPDATNGVELLWSLVTGGGVQSSPAVVDGVVYVGGGRTIYAMGARVPKLEPGGTARVTTTTSLRGGPASTAVERAELAEGTIVAITGESETTGDTVWWPVTVDETGDQGWVEADELEPIHPSD